MGCSHGKNLNTDEILRAYMNPSQQTYFQFHGRTILLDVKSYQLGAYFSDIWRDQHYRQNQEILLEDFKRQFHKSKRDIVWTDQKTFIKSFINNNYQFIMDCGKKKGFPDQFRWEIWKILVFNLERNYVYEELAYIPHEENEFIIDKDVLWTANKDPLFKSKNTIGSYLLWKLLKGLGGFFQEINYVQGMNFSAYFLLHVSGLKDVECFDFLIDFWKSRGYQGLFERDFPLVRFLCFVFHQKLSLFHPTLERWIKEIELVDEFWLVKWFLQFFIQILPKNFVLWSFDFLLVSNQFGLVEIALVIAHCLKPVFMELSLEELVDILGKQQQISQFITFDDFNEKIGFYENEKWNQKLLINEFLQKFPKFKYYFEKNPIQDEMSLEFHNENDFDDKESPMLEYFQEQNDYLNTLIFSKPKQENLIKEDQIQKLKILLEQKKKKSSK